ncbi:MAG: cell division protein FtsB [Thiotrichales bacterium]|jgi:cell division protein FtsB|nr:cell division protein FtsB [Thiotrichales bacterium]MBT3613836.1 cell division protein FtsB [Thiotrichales bacterium]MBT3752841.1 cell division protein FtsB [Thiotrichales bacterium]MBT3838251.1 cell division protein FtsB [Thiotrichales bacterium]MBT4151452.1 cell division protein FtsB [Thiotrichales bacterium]
MKLRLLIPILLLLLGWLQYEVWLSPKGIPQLWEMDREIARQSKLNRELEQCNSQLRAEVVDLKNGRDALEERARSELGMVMQNEIFFDTINEDSISRSSGINSRCVETSR